MQRLVFVNRFFFPDHSATSQILSDLAFHLAGAGKEVHVVTSTQIYDDPKALLPEQEIVHDVRVHRARSTRFGRAGLLGRSIDYLSFYRSAWHSLLAILRQDDIVIAKTDPPLISLVGMAAARRRGARLINWLQDVYPEVALKLRVPFLKGPIAAILIAWRNRSLRRAEATVVVGELMERRVRALGTCSGRIHVIPNWCNDGEIRPLAGHENPLRDTWGLQGKFVIGYSGNLGRAHEFATVLGAAEHLRDDPRPIFLMIGGGKRFDELARTVKQRRLDRLFRFVHYQPRKMLPYSLAVPDVHWISLNPELEGLIVPSKFYGIAAAGKPTIIIGAHDGELARLVRKHGCGIVVAPSDSRALARTLLWLSNDPRVLAEMGIQARRMLDANFSRLKGLERWRNLLDQLENRRCRTAGYNRTSHTDMVEMGKAP